MILRQRFIAFHVQTFHDTASHPSLRSFSTRARATRTRDFWTNILFTLEAGTDRLAFGKNATIAHVALLTGCRAARPAIRPNAPARPSAERSFVAIAIERDSPKGINGLLAVENSANLGDVECSVASPRPRDICTIATLDRAPNHCPPKGTRYRLEGERDSQCVRAMKCYLEQTFSTQSEPHLL